MTILSENLKTLRNKTNCTQMTLSKVLEIGHRTYVRYEAGERDAPVSVMVKLAKLANISLDQLLTTKIVPEDLDTSGLENTQNIIQNPEVISGSIENGRLMLKGFLEDNLVTNTKDEQKLLTLFRKVNDISRDKFLLDLKWAVNIRSRSRSDD
jgi:transcriptional regulator with XRE-family HTH domain